MSEDYDGDPACECEHFSHFHDVSPNSTTHVYFTRFKPEEMVVADTIWGKFPVCKTCKDTCLKDHLRKPVSGFMVLSDGLPSVEQGIHEENAAQQREAEYEITEEERRTNYGAW